MEKDNMKKTGLYSLACAVAVAALLVAGTPLRASETDERLSSAFRETYVYRTFFNDDSIKTEARDGVVTVTGTVADEFHRTLVLETVSNLPGVTAVVNQLETKAEAAEEKEDTWIGRKVRLSLLFHRNVDVLHTSIEVEGGIVTLRGEASSAAQKELTGEYARDIDGVREVRNDMTVAAAPRPSERTAGEKLDDASISAQVKTALLTHRATSAVNAVVKTREGEVTLTGIAKNGAEKSLVSKVIADIPGVVTVKNEMTVEEIK